MLENAYLLAKVGADTAENEQHFAEISPIGRRGEVALEGLQQLVAADRGASGAACGDRPAADSGEPSRERGGSRPWRFFRSAIWKKKMPVFDRLFRKFAAKFCATKCLMSHDFSQNCIS